MMLTDFEALHNAIDQWHTGVVPLPSLRLHLAAAVDANAQALGARTAAYHDVLLQVITRIESAASFSEESCSFSQTDFAVSLHDWLRKLEARLAPPL